MAAFTQRQLEYLRSQRLAHVATADAKGAPHMVPLRLGGGALFPAYSPLSTHPPRSELESGWVGASRATSATHPRHATASRQPPHETYSPVSAAIPASPSTARARGLSNTASIAVRVRSLLSGHRSP